MRVSSTFLCFQLRLKSSTCIPKAFFYIKIVFSAKIISNFLPLWCHKKANNNYITNFLCISRALLYTMLYNNNNKKKKINLCIGLVSGRLLSLATIGLETIASRSICRNISLASWKRSLGLAGDSPGASLGWNWGLGDLCLCSALLRILLLLLLPVPLTTGEVPLSGACFRGETGMGAGTERSGLRGRRGRVTLVGSRSAR